MSEEHEALRSWWEALVPPPAHRALAEEDAATRAAVDWLRRALAQAQPTSAAPQRAPAARFRYWRSLRRASAAAALLLLLGLGWRAQSATTRTPSTKSAQVPTSPRAPPETAPEATPVLSSAPTVELVENDERGLELRSGPVSLLLLNAKPRTSS